MQNLKQRPKLSATAALQLVKIEQELLYQKNRAPLQFYKHLPLTEEFHNDYARTKGIFGGNRSGKTEEGAEYVIEKLLEKPNQRWWAFAETFPVSVNVQQRKVAKLFPKDQIKYGSYDQVNGYTNNKLIAKNGSILIFKSYDQKRESAQSDDLDGIWNDEEPPFDIYREQRMRLIDRNGEMIITMTSLKGITDLMQDIFEDHDVVRSEYAPYAGKELPRIIEKDGIRFYFLWTTENPHISQDRVAKDIPLMTNQEILSRIYGLPVNLSGKIYMKFHKDVHVYPFLDVIHEVQDSTVYHILDPHDRKPFAMGWYAVTKSGRAICFDEWPDRNFNDVLFDENSYDDYKKIIEAKEDMIKRYCGKTVYKRIIDPNFGNKTVKKAETTDGSALTTPKKELSKRGFEFEDGNDALEPGHLAVRQALHWEEKNGEIIVQPNMIFTDNCQNHIRHHSRYSRKDITTADGDEKDNAQPKQKYKDFCDLNRYFWMHNPKYVVFQKFKPQSPGRMY